MATCRVWDIVVEKGRTGWHLDGNRRWGIVRHAVGPFRCLILARGTFLPLETYIYVEPFSVKRHARPARRDSVQWMGPFEVSLLAWSAATTRKGDCPPRSLRPNLRPTNTAVFGVDWKPCILRRKGIRVVSITEHADDSPTGKLMEAIIESVDEFYSENLAEDVVRGMREAASRGFFLGSKSPFGYKRVKVSDGAKERPTLEIDPAAAPVVKELLQSSLRGNGLMEICKELNDRGVTNRGKRWYKGGLHYLLTNEAYTGTAVWGRTTKGEKAQDPVRVEGAWPALVSREMFDAVQQAMRDRAPKVQRPARVGSRFLLSGLLKCGVCGRPYSAQGAKSGQFAYYICGTLFREGAGTCSARYLNAPRVEDFVVEKIRERILTEETIVELVKLVAEEIDAMAGELSGRLEVIDAELGDVQSRLQRLYEALETSELTLGGPIAPHLLSEAPRGAAGGCARGRRRSVGAAQGGVAHHRGDQGVRGRLP